MSGLPHRIGIELGGTKIEGIVLDADGQAVVRERVETESARGYAHIIERIALLVERLRRAAPTCRTIGIGTPGAISSRDGTLKNSNTQCLNGTHLREDLEACLHMSVRMENDANLFALA